MKKRLAVSLAGTLIALVIGGCAMLTVPDDEGTLVFSFADDGLATQTITPDLSMDPATYDVRGSGPQGATFERLGIVENEIAQASLIPGEWTVSAYARNADGTVIGEGSASVVVVSGEVVSVTIPVRPIEGTGELDIQVSWPAGVLTTPQMFGSLAPSGGGASIALPFTAGAGGISSGTLLDDLPNGYYLAQLRLEDQSTTVWSTVEAVRIISGERSTGVYALTSDVNRGGLAVEIEEALENPYEITFNSGSEVALEEADQITITATVTPDDPGLSYAWYLNGTATGDVGPSITIGSLLPGGVHWLSLVVTNGPVLSSGTVRLTVAGDVAVTPGANFVYVSTSGNDSSAGTPTEPLRTINAALLAAAASSSAEGVRVAAGTYPELVELQDGVPIEGGFSADGQWLPERGVTIISGEPTSDGVIGIRAANITAPTRVSNLTVATIDALGAANDTYGVHVVNSPGVVLTDLVVAAGRGGAGSRGRNGAAGSVGASGLSGAPGSADGSAIGAGGPGGASGFGVSGGRGGNGGAEGANRGANGAPGAGPRGGSAGIGGQGGDPGRAGSSGGRGGNGDNGADGLGGSAGLLAGSYWMAQDGGDGSNGAPGSGGGGGGGGGGQGCFWCNDGTGNGGGGGGAGGGGGSRGTGGTAGGSSFALFVVSSTGITIEGGSYTSGVAGNGGDGGTGGPGGSGGFGAPGATVATVEIGAGGRGGDGGNGGRGGHGGGGAGGSSIAVFLANTVADLSSAVLATGGAGSGGTSPAGVSSRGEDGLDQTIYTW